MFAVFIIIIIFSVITISVITMEPPLTQSYTINGVKVLFPCKAYPSQLSMMDKVMFVKCKYNYDCDMLPKHCY